MGSHNHHSRHQGRLWLASAMLSLVFVLVLSGMVKGDCSDEMFPRTIVGPAFLGDDGEMHIGGTYQLDVSETTHNMTFTLTVTSSFRISVTQPREEVGLALYVSQGSYLELARNYSAPESTIFMAALPVGTYKLSFIPLRSLQACHSVVIEWAITPVSVVLARKNDFSCPSSDNYPSTNDIFSSSINGPVSYSTQQDPNHTPSWFAAAVPQPGQTGLRWITGWEFKLPKLSGRSGLWNVKATLGYDFLTSGSLGLLLGPSTTTANATCVGCILGEKTTINHNTLNTVLGPGTYKLWFYDNTDVKNSTISSCSPYSLDINMTPLDESENALSCIAPPIPTDLNLAGYLDDAGFLDYADYPFFDVSGGTKPSEITFHLDKASFFRVYIQSSTIDFDLDLYSVVNDNKTHLAGSYKSSVYPDVIVAQLAPGNYSLGIKTFGSFQHSFCQTFYLQIGILPSLSFSDSYCDGVSTTAPDFVGFQQAIKNPPFSWSTSDKYVYQYEGYHQQLVFSETFTTDDELAIHITLGFNFLLNDMNVYISDVENSVEYFLTSRHDGNFARLIGNVPAGTYTIKVQTGYTQSLLPPLDLFPSCLEYTFSMMVKAAADAPKCWHIPSFPTNLNTPAYLGRIGRTHFAKDFLLPTFTFSGDQAAYFTVDQVSILRAYTPGGAKVDVDFTLYEDSKLVNYSMSSTRSDELAYIVSVGKTYTLHTRFWGSGARDPCSTFQVEIALAPIPSNFRTTCKTSVPDLKTITLNPSTSDRTSIYHSEHSYAFNQQDTPFSSTIYLNVPNAVEFRAMIQYNFIQADVGLALANNATGALLRYGSSGNNYENLGPILLQPGTYNLYIAEPVRVDAEVRGCVKITLSLWAITANFLDDDPSVLGACSQLSLPIRLDSAGYISPVSGNMFNFVARYLINTKGVTESSQFSLTQPSLFRAYLPPIDPVDIDIVLYNGNNDIVQSSRGYYESEWLVAELQPDNYKLEVRYYSFNGPFPAASECQTFPLALSLTPVSAISSKRYFTEPCNDTTPPSTLNPTAYPSTPTLYHHNGQLPLLTNISFSVENFATFQFHVMYDFPTAGIELRLNGTVYEAGHPSAITKLWPASIGVNQAYLQLVLPQGDYLLTITNGKPTAFSYIQCQYYAYYYVFNATTTDPGSCDDANTFPVDLYSPDGGSQGFGGPQQSGTGNIFLTGSFYIPSGSARFAFKVPRAGWVKAMTSTKGATFQVVRNDTENVVAPTLDGVWSLATGVHIFSIEYIMPIGETCPTLDFSFVLKANTSVTDELMCPMTLPSPEVPPTNILLDNNSTSLVFSDLYLFTSQRISRNGVNGKLTYPITLDVRHNLTVHIAVGFEVLATSFSMSLQQGRITFGRSYYTPATNNDGYVNFYSVIDAQLQPGLYALFITDTLRQAFGRFPSYCHRFTFDIETVATSSTPILSRLTPVGASNLSPLSDLNVNFYLSNPLAFPARGVLLNRIKSSQLIYLQQLDNSAVKVVPIFATLDPTGELLSVTFSQSDLFFNNAYQLYINLDAFSTKDQTHFTDPYGYASNVIYRMASCTCNGKGTCNQTTGTCNCTEGYAGKYCESCAEGYHGAVDQCLPNVQCSADTCNGHGKCKQTKEGSAVCTCDEGYGNTATSFCSVCAPGYSGYPDCTSDTDDENVRCNLPLIPTTLDTPAFLGFTGRVHLQDYYYIDLYHKHHEITFNITQKSLFRLFVPPHDVDIDTSLWLVNADGSKVRKAATMTFNDAESIYMPIDACTSGQYYQVQLRYYVWRGVTVTDCEQFDLDLEIVPFETAQSEITAFNSGKCTNSNNLPLQDAQYADRYTVDVTKGLSYAPQSLFTVNADSSQWFFGWNFTVPNIPVGQVATLTASLEDRFLTGALAMVLEYGNNQDHCGIGSSFRGNRDACVTGRDIFNGHILSTSIGTGNYTLWIYQPSSQNSAVSQCSVFSFKLEIAFEQDDEDEFNCPFPLLPESLDFELFHQKPPSQQKNRLHLTDEFAVSQSGDVITFNITTTSEFRLAATSQSIVYVSVLPAGGDFTSNIVADFTLGSKVDFSVVLTPGLYEIDVRLISWFRNDFCATIKLEVGIIPRQAFYGCSSVVESLPSLPSDITVPFFFNIPQDGGYPFNIPTYAAFSNNHPDGVITAFNFTFDIAVYLKAQLSFEFADGDISVIVEATNRTTANHFYAIGDNQYNNNYLGTALQPGTYELRIVYANGNKNVLKKYLLHRCTNFNFQLSVVALGGPDDLACSQVGEEIPLTLDTLRFSGSKSGYFDYQSPQWRIPKPELLSSNTSSYFTVRNQPAIFHAFIDKADHDVDLMLFAVNPDGTMNTTARSRSGFDEEEIVALLQPGVYYLRFKFYNWHNLKGCAFLNMEWSLQPVAPLTPYCPQLGGDFWPPDLPTTLGKDIYTYDSDDTGDYLYYQQRSGETRSKTYFFKLEQVADVYVELNFDFSTGSLMVHLSGKKSTIQFYGAKIRDGTVLIAQSLPVDDYQLTIYEATTDLDQVLGCSYFAYRIIVRNSNYGNLIAQELQTIPMFSSLDTISGLKFNQVVELEGDYLLFKTRPAKATVTFTLNSKSLVRFRAVGLSDDWPIVLNLTNSAGDSIAVANTTLLTEADAGSYTLTFKYLYHVTFVPVTANLQVGIAPVSVLSAAIQQRPLSKTCAKQTIPPIGISNGFYQYRSDSITLPQTTLSSTKLIQNLVINLDSDSLVYAQLGFNFLLDELQMSIFDQGNYSLNGYNNYNLQEINAVLPAGHYILQIQQPVLFNFDDLAHCSFFSFAITITDAATFTGDCTAYQTIPSSLNSNAADAFGGRIDSNGNAHIYGTDFVVPEVASDRLVGVSVKTESLISIFIAYNDLPSTYIGVSVSNDTAVIPSITTHTTAYGAGYLTTYDLTSLGSPSRLYTIDFAFRTIPQGYKCPTASVDFFVRPVSAILDLIGCPDDSSVVMPQKNPDFSVSFQESLTSYLTEYTMLSDYKISLTTGNSYATFQAEIGYNSLLSTVELGLEVVNGDSSSVILQWGQTAPSGEQGDDKNLIVTLNSRLGKNKKYHLIIRARPFGTTILLSPPYCVPYSWNFQIAPDSPDTTPYIVDVTPNGATEINAKQNLILTVTLSTTAYYQSRAQNKTNTQGITAGLALKDLSSGNQITPSLVRSDDTGLVWTITFPSSKLQFNRNYQFTLVPGTLYNSLNQEFKVRFNYVYTTLNTTCNRHGTPDATGAQCDCDPGYVSPQCDKCEAGYRNIGGQGENMNCVQGSRCTANICSNGGTCDDSTGEIVCTCKPQYTGQYCQSCATGYEHYPSCDPKCSVDCPPERGVCNSTFNGCNCFPEFAGATCEKCAKGFKGPLCTERDGSGIDVVRISGIFFTGAVIMTTIVWFVWWQIRKRSSAPARNRNFFPSMDLDDDDEEEARELDSNIVGGGSAALDESILDDEPTPFSSSTVIEEDSSFDPRGGSNDKAGGDPLFSL